MVLPPRRIVIALALSTMLRSATGIAGDQIADPSFDASVARPTYTDKHPAVLFDEAHHNLHTSVGRYKPFVELIKNDGYRVTPNRASFEPRALEGFDILVIANAAGKKETDPAFTSGECDEVYKWVRAGGALLLIADHAPFGAAAKILANRFGVDMSNGYTSDRAHCESISESWLVFSRENGLLGAHPITNGRTDAERVARVVSFTGQSLKGPEGSVAFLKLAASAIDKAPPDFKHSVSAAGRAQGVAFPCGKGRVVVIGEAAMLSAQVVREFWRKPHSPHGMNFPGTNNRQLVLNLAHWLSGLTN